MGRMDEIHQLVRLTFGLHLADQQKDKVKQIAEHSIQRHEKMGEAVAEIMRSDFGISKVTTQEAVQILHPSPKVTEEFFKKHDAKFTAYGLNKLIAEKLTKVFQKGHLPYYMYGSDEILIFENVKENVKKRFMVKDEVTYEFSYCTGAKIQINDEDDDDPALAIVTINERYRDKMVAILKPIFTLLKSHGKNPQIRRESFSSNIRDEFYTRSYLNNWVVDYMLKLFHAGAFGDQKQFSD